MDILTCFNLLFLLSYDLRHVIVFEISKVKEDSAEQVSAEGRHSYFNFHAVRV